MLEQLAGDISGETVVRWHQHEQFTDRRPGATTALCGSRSDQVMIAYGLMIRVT